MSCLKGSIGLTSGLRGRCRSCVAQVVHTIVQQKICEILKKSCKRFLYSFGLGEPIALFVQFEARRGLFCSCVVGNVVSCTPGAEEGLLLIGDGELRG